MLESKNSKKQLYPNFKKENKHFIIYYSEKDKDCINELLNILEYNYNDITNKFNFRLRDKLIVELHWDINHFHTALGFTGPDWIRGGLRDGKIIIKSPLNPPPGSGYNNVIRTAVHEFIHIIIRKINPNIPRWLDEGIASYEAKDNSEKWIKDTVKKGLKEDSIPSFKDLDTKEDFEAFFKKDGYQFSYTIAESIVNIFGYDKLYRLIVSPDRFKDVFGLTEIELGIRWIEYIRNNY